jgi:hypothetical protein
MRFADVAIGTEFFDPFFGDGFRKTSELDAERLTGPNEGFLVTFGTEAEVELV